MYDEKTEQQLMHSKGEHAQQQQQDTTNMKNQAQTKQNAAEMPQQEHAQKTKQEMYAAYQRDLQKQKEKIQQAANNLNANPNDFNTEEWIEVLTLRYEGDASKLNNAQISTPATKNKLQAQRH